MVLYKERGHTEKAETREQKPESRRHKLETVFRSSLQIYSGLVSGF